MYLAEVLAHVKPVRGQAKHVIFEGGDSLPNGPYGTSQLLSWATSTEKGMLIGQIQAHTAADVRSLTFNAAWAMNGLPLEPDHGFPVRVIIPGQIGGRSVKVRASCRYSGHGSQIRNAVASEHRDFFARVATSCMFTCSFP